MKIIDFEKTSEESKNKLLDDLRNKSRFIVIWPDGTNVLYQWFCLSEPEIIGMLEQVKLDILVEKWLAK